MIQKIRTLIEKHYDILAYLFFGVLGLLASISLGVIYILRDYYINMFKEAFSEKDEVKIPLFTLAFILPMLIFAVLNLF